MGTVMLAVLNASSKIAAEPAVKEAATSGTWTEYVIPMAVALLGSSVLAAIWTAITGGLRAGAAARRERYAAAVGLLAARIEYPYRIRRRTSDEPETFARLADLGHDLQQRLAEARAWVAAENSLLGEVFNTCLLQLDKPFKTACRAAWETQPIASAAQMNLNGFGLGDQQDVVTRMECALVYRFGWRRCIPNSMLRKLLRDRGCLQQPGTAPSQESVQPTHPPGEKARTDARTAVLG